MRRLVDQVLVLAPQSAQEVSLKVVIEPSILKRIDAQVFSAEVSLAFASGEQTISIQEECDITVYGRGALRSELGRVYVALQLYDTAIKSAYNYLRGPNGEQASTYNHLGILHYFKG